MYYTLDALIDKLMDIKHKNNGEELQVKLSIDLDDLLEGQNDVYSIDVHAGTVYISN